MDLILAIPLPVRLLLLTVVGAMAGSAINLAAYRLAWNQRLISPWSASPNGVPPRAWSDRIPIYGWWGLARGCGLHGPRFWLRPLLVELPEPAWRLAVLYAWETQAAQGVVGAAEDIVAAAGVSDREHRGSPRTCDSSRTGCCSC